MGNKLAIVLAVAVSLPLTAAAQREALRHAYENSATIPTNVEGIRAYPVPPAGFDYLTASDEELAAYGIPLRPNQQRDPIGFAHWTRFAAVMSNPHSRWHGELKPRRVRGGVESTIPSAGGSSTKVLNATSVQGRAWSGVVNTVPLTSYSSSKSFSWVEGNFTVPWGQQAFEAGGGNICDGDTDYAAIWVGLGGMTSNGVNLGNQNNIAQTGVDTYASCGDQGAFAWVEWFPGPAVELFPVVPGEDIHVFIQSLSATSASFYIADMTRQIAAGYAINAPKGYKLVGNEAEYIVERPRGDSSTPTGLYPLANYIWSLWDVARAQDFTGTYHYPGGTATDTYRVSMTDDSQKNIISVPNADMGTQSLFVFNQGCSYKGGCTP